MTTNRRTIRRGFTLVESLVAVLIVSGVMIAALNTLGGIGKARKNQVDRTSASLLANQLLAEIMQCYFKEPGSDTTLGADAGETARASFDDVDDYDGFTATPPQQRDGSVIPGYAGWTQNVTVRCVRPGSPTTAAAPGDTQVLKLITVKVTTAAGVSVTVNGLRGVDGAYEQIPTATTNYLTWTGVTAQVGTTGRTAYGAARPLNVTTSQ